MKKFLEITYISAITVRDNMLNKARKLVVEEKGGAEILAVIILLAIVILLAVAFRAKIATIVTSIWNAIANKETEITAPFGG